MSLEIGRMTRLSHGPDMLAKMLDETEWSNDFSWHQLNKVARYMEAWKARDGDVIFNEGDKDNSLSIIVKGTVVIVKSDHDHNVRQIATLHAPQCLGEMSLIDGSPRSAGARAKGDVTTLVLSRESFLDLAKDSPMLAVRVILKISSMLSKRLRKAMGELVEWQNRGA